jgi:hypothetical protein
VATVARNLSKNLLFRVIQHSAVKKVFFFENKFRAAKKTRKQSSSSRVSVCSKKTFFWRHDTRHKNTHHNDVER